ATPRILLDPLSSQITIRPLRCTTPTGDTSGGNASLPRRTWRRQARKRLLRGPSRRDQREPLVAAGYGADRSERPKGDAFVERFVRMVRHEVLDLTLVLGRWHLAVMSCAGSRERANLSVAADVSPIGGSRQLKLSCYDSRPSGAPVHRVLVAATHSVRGASPFRGFGSRRQ